MNETVLMISPEGEQRRVEATPAALVPLMIRGWRQVTEQEVTDARPDAGDQDWLRVPQAD
jgi:hypothetical protein